VDKKASSQNFNTENKDMQEPTSKDTLKSESDYQDKEVYEETAKE
jgi:hypothetical protein